MPAAVTFSQSLASVTGTDPAATNVVAAAPVAGGTIGAWATLGQRTGDGAVPYTPLAPGGYWGKLVSENLNQLSGGIEFTDPQYFYVLAAGAILAHSPADILRRLLVDLGQATDPPPAAGGAQEFSPWPASAYGELTTPDNTVTLTDTAGRLNGRDMFGGVWEYPGVQLRVRASPAKLGYMKIRQLLYALDRGVYQNLVVLNNPDGSGASTYRVQSVSRTTGVLDIGWEKPGSKNRVFTANYVVTVDPE